MKSSFGYPVLITIILSLLIPFPCIAGSSDILIIKEGSQMDWADAHIDNNLVAAFVSSTKPPVIKVYHADGRLSTEIPLSREVMKLDALEIANGRVYYSEYNPEEAGYLRNETVYEYNLTTREKRIIYTTSGPQQKITKIAASGDNVVLRGGSNNQILILHTGSTGTSRQIFTSNSMIHSLALDGDRIMWGSERVDNEPGREIHIYTISTEEDSIIPESKSIRTWGYGDISGNRVVWNMAAGEPDTSLGYPNLVNAGGDIRLTDLSTGKTQSIEILNTPETPFISGDSVVYLKKPDIDYNNSDTGTVRVYDISTGSFSDIASEVASISDFNSGMILWHKLKPMSFWVTSLSGNVPATSSSIITTTNANPERTDTARTPAPESLVGAIIIVLAVIAGIVVHVTLKIGRYR